MKSMKIRIENRRMEGAVRGVWGMTRAALWVALTAGMSVWGEGGVPRPGSLDPSLRAGFVLGAGESVGAAVRDAKGRWLIGKGRTVLRLTPAGAVDGTFDAQAESDGTIQALAVGVDGRIFAGGNFTRFGGERSPGLVKLGEDGRRENFVRGTGPLYLSGHPGGVTGLALQTDGRLLVTGNFGTWDGLRAPSVTRLGVDGGMDREFTENLRPIFGGATNTTVTSTNVNGEWISVTNVTVSHEVLSKSGTMGPIVERLGAGSLVGGVVLAELAADGKPVAVIPENPGVVWRLLSNGEVLVVVSVGSPGPVRAVQLRRWRLGVEPRVAWETNLACDGRVQTVAVDRAGRILMGGDFARVAGHRRTGLVRLNADGTVDGGFWVRLEAEGGVEWELMDSRAERASVMGVESDGDDAIWVHGRFARVDGVDVPGLARLHGGQLPMGLPELGLGATEVECLEGQSLQLGFPIGSATPVRCGWSRDGEVLSGADSPVLNLGKIRWGQSGTYRIRVTNDVGWVEGPPIRVRVGLGATHPGSVDGTFRGGVVILADGSTGGSGWLSGIGVSGEQAYVYGAFEQYEGHATRHVARIQADGRVDRDFMMLRGDPRSALAVQVDRWQLLVDGRFVAMLEFPFEVWSKGERKYALVACRSDGSADSTFVPAIRTTTSLGTFGPLAAASDGGLWVSGLLEWVGSGEKVSLARLRADGSRDSGFPGIFQAMRQVRALVAHQDGGVIVAWVGTSGTGPVEIKRYGSNGVEDSSFQVDATGWTDVLIVHQDGEGRLLVAPRSRGGVAAPVLVRYLRDGRADPGFRLELDPGWPASLQTTRLGIQSDGRLVLGLGSSIPTSAMFPMLARWEADGRWDRSFQYVDEGRVSPTTRVLAIGPGDGLVMAGAGGDALVRIHAHDERRLEALRQSGGVFEATVWTRVGRNYHVEATAEPGSGVWQSSGSFGGDGKPMTIREAMSDRRFFRLRLTEHTGVPIVVER